MIVVPQSRFDEQITAIRIKYGMVGYGAYTWLLDTLYTNGGAMQCAYTSLAYDMHLEQEVEMVKAIIEDYGLFVVKDGQFASVEIDQLIRAEHSRKAASARWSKTHKEKVEETPSTPHEKQEDRQLSIPGFEEVVGPQEEVVEPIEPVGKPVRNVVLKSSRPKSVEEVAEYIRSKGITNVDPQYFWDKNEGNGWTTPRGHPPRLYPIANWKNVVNTWSNKAKKGTPYGNNKQQPAIAEGQHGGCGGIPSQQHFEDRW